MKTGVGRLFRRGGLALTTLALGGCATFAGTRDGAIEEASVPVPADWAFSDTAPIAVDLSE